MAFNIAPHMPTFKAIVESRIVIPQEDDCDTR